MTNAGFVGSAMKVRAGTVSGYVAVSTFPNKRANRKMIFDIEESVLRKRLPPCAEDS